jgi:exonuclease III
MPWHVVSWNVAGWARTVDCIERQHGSVKAYLEAHKIDILCLQEVDTALEIHLLH